MTMDQLINLAKTSPYYRKVLAQAIARTGRVAADEGDLIRDYDRSEFGPFVVTTSSTPKADLIAVPPQVLPYIKPENRGEEFPPGYAFEELK